MCAGSNTGTGSPEAVESQSVETFETGRGPGQPAPADPA